MRVLPYTTAHLDAPIWDSEEEFERMLPRLRWHLHSPHTTICCVERFGDVLGIGAAQRFGDQARITICKLLTGSDINAVRSLLMEHLIAELYAQGCAGITVTVPPEQRAAWEAQGFTAQEHLLEYTGGRFYEAQYEDVVWIEPQHRMTVMYLDKRCCGYDRTTLLQEHEYLGRVYLEGNAVQGFALALLGHALIVANAPHVGLELQRWILPTQAHLLIPEGNATAHAHLLERGYRAEAAGLRMTHGEVPPYRPDLIYAEPYGTV